MGYSSMANPKLNRDTICRNQPTAVLWQQQISDSAMSLNLSSKFTWTREQRQAAPRHLQNGQNGANVQINDSVGRRAACQTGHCLVTTALSPRVSTHYLLDEHFLDLLHQRFATTMSEWWIDLVRRQNGPSSPSTQNRSNPPRTPACTNWISFFFIYFF